jgi:hypothetical protein
LRRGATQYRDCLGVSGFGAEQQVSGRVDWGSSRAVEVSGGRAVHRLADGGRDVLVYRLAKQVMSERQCLTVVIENPGPLQEFQVRQDQPLGRPVQQGGRVVSGEAPAQN